LSARTRPNALRKLSFWQSAKNANSEQELNQAADHFATAVTLVGVNALLVFATRRTGPLKPARSLLAAEEVWWSRFTKALKFEVPEGKGVLWSGISEERAKLLASKAGKQTLEMTLENMGFRQMIEARLARMVGVQFGDKRAMVWKPLSTKLAQSLRGTVTVFVDRAELEKNLAHEIPREAMRSKTGTSDLRVACLDDPYPEAWEALLMSELDELTEGLLDNPKVTSIHLWDTTTGKLWSTVDWRVGLGRQGSISNPVRLREIACWQQL